MEESEWLVEGIFDLVVEILQDEGQVHCLGIAFLLKFQLHLQKALFLLDFDQVALDQLEGLGQLLTDPLQLEVPGPHPLSLLHLLLDFDVHLLDGFQVYLDEASLGLQGAVLLEALLERAVRVLLSELGCQIAVLGLDLDDKLEDFLAVGLSEIGEGVLFEFCELAGLAELALQKLFESAVHMVFNIIAQDNFWGYFLISNQIRLPIGQDSSSFCMVWSSFIFIKWPGFFELSNRIFFPSSSFLALIEDTAAFPSNKNTINVKQSNPKNIKLIFNTSPFNPSLPFHTQLISASCSLSILPTLQMSLPRDAYLQQLIMLQQPFSQESSLYFYYFVAFILLIVGYHVYNKHFSKKRLHAVKNRLVPQARSEQVIVAWEIDGLLVELSDRKKQGFSRLEIETTGLHYAYEKMKEMFGMGVFYKAKMSIKNIRNILQSLADNPKVKLFLYTTLDLKVAQLILEKLCLLNFFGVENRRSCSDRYSEPMKHPTEVDCNTKRVIILTGSCSDHLQEDSKYFLVIKKKELGNSVKVLSKIIGKNSNVDELHNQLGELKAMIESDYENNE